MDGSGHMENEIWHRVALVDAAIGAMCARLFGEVPVFKTCNPNTSKIEHHRPGSPFLIGWEPVAATQCEPKPEPQARTDEPR